MLFLLWQEVMFDLKWTDGPEGPGLFEISAYVLVLVLAVGLFIRILRKKPESLSISSLHSAEDAAETAGNAAEKDTEPPPSPKTRAAGR